MGHAASRVGKGNADRSFSTLPLSLAERLSFRLDYR